MATPDKTVDSAAESLFGDERLRSNLTDAEAGLVLNAAVGWLDKRAAPAAPAAGLKAVGKDSAGRRVSQSDIDRVRQVVSAINGVARAPGTPRLDAAVAEVARPSAGDKPLSRLEVLSLLMAVGQALLDIRTPQK